MRRLDDIAGRGQISSAEMRRIVSGLGAGQDSPALAALLEAVQWAQANPDSHEETIQRFRAVVNKFPTFFPGWSMLAGALLSAPDADRSDEMVRVARTSMEVLPNDPRAGELAYELLRAIGRLEEAAGAAREWRDRSAGDTFQAEVALAGAELQLGRAPAAMATLERWTQRILSEADDRPAQLELLALVYAANGRMKGVILAGGLGSRLCPAPRSPTSTCCRSTTGR
jgi:hypothetical protein